MNNSNEYIVECNNLTKCYKNRAVVNSATFKVKKGEILGLVGLNGAGKTTLIRLLTGIISPTSGSFSLFGIENTKDISSSLKKMSTMIEHPALYNDLNAFDNLAISCKLKGRSVDVDYINSKLNDVGLAINNKTAVKNYSLGMKQRLGIAIATIDEPELMILDEPTNGLDPEGIQDVRNLLIKINKEKGTTIIISSHILSELSKFATSYVFMNHGCFLKQIEEKELINSIGGTIIIHTENDEKAAKLFSDKGLEVTKDNERLIVRGYEKNIDVLNLLINENIKVLSFKENEQSLEDYFLKLIGAYND